MRHSIVVLLFVLVFILLPAWLSAEKTLDGDNLTYLGAIRLPGSVWANDIAFYPGGDPSGGGDGFPGSFYVISGPQHYDKAVEVSIPAPQIRANEEDLPQAQILRGPQTITCNEEPEHDRFGGIAYLPAQGAVSEKLYWNIHEYYNVDGRDHDPGGWVNPDFTGCAGTWHYGPRGGTYHSMKIEQFMFRIWDTDWADSVLGGCYLISGKTREAGCCGSGQGINLYGVAPYLSGNPPADGSTVSAQVLMHYGTAGSPTRDFEMPGINGDPPYVATDRFLGGAWVRVGAEDAIVIIGRKSLGPVRYGVGGSGDCNNHQGYHGDPYEPRFWFIDPTDFEPVIAGTDDPWDVVPYTTYNPIGETYNDHCTYDYETFGGADFDYANSLLYVVEPNLNWPNRLDVIHVYRVTGSGPPPPPVCGDGNCDPGEGHNNCPADCPPPPICGDGNCDPGEDPSSCPADCQAPPPPTGVVAHYELDEGSGVIALDSSGNGHNGTLVNGAGWTSRPAVSLDGQNDYIDVGSFDVSGGELTLAAWVFSDNLTNCGSGDCRIISKATSTAEGDHYWMLSTINAGAGQKLRFRLKTNGTTSTLIASSGDLPEDTWVHVAAVYDGSNMLLYLDGDPVGSASKSGAVSENPTVPVWIGAGPTDATIVPWDGAIDDVRVYDVALSEAEIDAIIAPTSCRVAA